MPQKKSRAGRPRKFAEASHPVTITLPERVLNTLDDKGLDRAKAVVQAVDRMLGAVVETGRVKVEKVSRSDAVLLVPACPPLETLPFLRLVPVGVGWHLLAVKPGTPLESLELGVADVLENLGPSDAKFRTLLQDLREHLTRGRRQHNVQKAEILFVPA